MLMVPFSAKRREDPREYQEFVDVNAEKILKHCTTRWVSLEKAVTGTLSQWPVLLSYFGSHEDAGKRTSTAERILQMMRYPLMKQSMSFVLGVIPDFTGFNLLYQVKLVNLTYYHFYTPVI